LMRRSACLQEGLHQNEMGKGQLDTLSRSPPTLFPTLRTCPEETWRPRAHSGPSDGHGTTHAASLLRFGRSKCIHDLLWALCTGCVSSSPPPFSAAFVQQVSCSRELQVSTDIPWHRECTQHKRCGPKDYHFVFVLLNDVLFNLQKICTPVPLQRLQRGLCFVPSSTWDSNWTGLQLEPHFSSFAWMMDWFQSVKCRRFLQWGRVALHRHAWCVSNSNLRAYQIPQIILQIPK
jgi:hypothetical protein